MHVDYLIAPIRKKPRAGWAEASKRLAATRDVS